MSTIVELADRQLAAYNRADLDGFCACYADDVRVLDADGQLTCSGAEAFRERYAAMFQRGGFGATVQTRITLGDHSVELEHFWREQVDGTRVQGSVLVRYTGVESRIAIVQFLR